AAALLGGRAAGEMDDVGAAIRRIDDVAVPGALQRVERRILGGDDVLVGMGLVRPLDAARTGEGAGVLVAGAALGGEQVVPGGAVFSLALVEMRALDQLQVGALVDVADGPDQFLLDMIVFLQRNAREQQRAGPMVP